ncbi:Hypothetical protein PHPALM_5238 [Phytophthora palmivora]|uniref:Uncharacterized protein n=1 Tax=Phytophthora palmivora TaxID=4796 RepID=A0A2P4YHW0_9STRA|nr:Hypothetical protein PHPALM_5238 [Phytophthora palmivora]
MVPVLTPQDGSPSVWRSLAMIESEGRERAERTNRELKAIMASHMKVHAAIQKLLRRSNLLEGMDFVFESNPTLDRPLHQLDFSDAINAENPSPWLAWVPRVIPVGSVLKADLSISCTSRCKYHELAGKCIESTSTTPMVCSVQKAAGILWHHITTKKNKDTQKAFRFIRTRNNNTLERNCKALLPDGTNSFVSLAPIQFKILEATIMYPSPTDPLHACVVQSCYQLKVKGLDTAAVLPLDFAHVEKVVLNSIGGKLRNVLQLQQKVLLGNVDFTSVGEDFGNGTGKC